jgi:predicted CoA-binding protein
MRSPEKILRDTKTIALVGASPNPAKPSHGVMRYLLAQGYDVIPCAPLDCDDVLGVPCVATLGESTMIDLVDVFRRSEHTAAHARGRSTPARRRCGSNWASARRKRAESLQRRPRLRRGSARPSYSTMEI